jgi:uracil-DNA glycosylase
VAGVQAYEMTLLNHIEHWQQRATRIAPPENTAILPARGGLPGPAFFPEGLGLQNPSSENWPTVMAIGHNFGCEDYRSEIEAAGREDDKATWRNLRRLLADAEVGIGSCYMTNWFVGLQPGDKQMGEFLALPSPRYEAECRQLLLDQIEGLKPSVILLLGLPVVARAYGITPTLRPWAAASNWSVVDTSSIGPVALDVEVPGTCVRANVVALLHPSFSPSNQRYRRSMVNVPKPEVEMIRRATTAACSPPCR